MKRLKLDDYGSINISSLHVTLVMRSEHVVKWVKVDRYDGLGYSFDSYKRVAPL